MAEIARLLAPDGVLLVGYFPPSLGGCIHQGNAWWQRLLTRLYRFIISRRGFVDRADLRLESDTLRLAGDYFTDVGTVPSGEHWRLIMARGTSVSGV